MYVKRHIEDAVRKRANYKGAVVVTGARLVKQVAPAQWQA
jgi:hypothetical protein